MENEIESTEPPPVSSLRSRFEAMARGRGEKESNESAPSTSNSVLNKKVVEGRQSHALPQVSLKPTPSEDSTNALRRVVSSPASQPSSPTADRTTFGSSNSVSKRISAFEHENVNRDKNTTATFSPPTPRRTAVSHTPSASLSGTATEDSRLHPAHIGLGLPSTLTNKVLPRSASGSSIQDSSSVPTRGTAKTTTDVENASRKLTKRPPPPPPLKKAPPPPPARGLDSRASTPSSRSATPSIDISEHSSLSTNSLTPPALPSRNTPSPLLPPRPSSSTTLYLVKSNTDSQTPQLPPRSSEYLATIVYHAPNGGFKTPSNEKLSLSTVEQPTSATVPSAAPPLPSRDGSNAYSTSIQGVAPALPPRSPVANPPSPDSTPLAPPLPPRTGTASRNGSTEEVSTLSSLTTTPITLMEAGQRRVPPYPATSRPASLYSASPAASREALAIQADFIPPDVRTKSPTPPLPPPRPLTTENSSTSILPPPTRTVATGLNDGPAASISSNALKHKDHSFPHLPHSLPISKILAAVKISGGAGNGTRHHSNAGVESRQDISPLEKENLADLLPPPVRRAVGKGLSNSRPSSAGGGAQRSSSASSSDEEDENGERPRTATFETGVGKDNTTPMKRVIHKQGEELPDSSRSDRKPPFLEGFQHPPNVLAAHHRPASRTSALGRANPSGSTEIHVPHQGVVAVAGWWVVVASAGVITVTNMNATERETMGGGGAVGYDGHEYSDTSGAKGVWTIDMSQMPIQWKVDKPRVTAMEFRHSPPSGTSSSLIRSASKGSMYHSALNGTATRLLENSQEGRYLWCGTRDGALFELDIWNGGRLTDFRVGVHSGVVTGIYRLSNNRMLSIDENGKCQVFTGVGKNHSVDQFGARPGAGATFALSESTPRTTRIPFKEGFAKTLGDRLWTSSTHHSSSTATSSAGTNGSASRDQGPGDSKASLASTLGGSLTSLAPSPHPPSHNNHKHKHGPVIRVHDIDENGMIFSRNLVPDPEVGPVTCGTILPQTPGLVYLGHQSGWVTIWDDRMAIGSHSKTTRSSMYRHSNTLSADSTSSFASTEGENKSGSEGTSTDSPTAAAPPLPPRSRQSPMDATNLPVCIRKVKVSTSSITALEGVGSRLWAGAGNGSIMVYDIHGEKSELSSRSPEETTVNSDEGTKGKPDPWVVTNVWKAYHDRPVTKLCVDQLGLTQTQKLLVYSIARDDTLQFWDGLLSQNWIDLQMVAREPSYCAFRPLRVLICTWNVDAAKPECLNGSTNANFIRMFLTTSPGTSLVPDMIVFGLQEVIDLEDKKLTAKTVLLGSGKRKADGTISEKVSRHYKLWHDRLVVEVQAAFPSESYIVQHTENMVGLFTCAFVRRSVAHPAPDINAISDQAITTIKCGMGRMYGNKGAIVARFTVDDTSFCFLNCHLAAGQHQRVARNLDLATILEEKSIFSLDPTRNSDVSYAYVGGGDGSMILDHEICFLGGDLNYRIDQRRDAVVNHVQAGRLDHLLQYDQLLHEMKTNRSFRLHTFNEPLITFAPTYKYDRHTNDYDTSEKKRVPSWCDRILHRSKDPTRIRPLWYGRFEADISDHRPVCGVYDVVVKKIIPSKRQTELEAVLTMWEKERAKLIAELCAFYGNTA